MSLAEFLADRDIRQALIVDDSYDVVPTAADMRVAVDEWTNFIDDLTIEQRALISARYPAAEGRRFDELIQDDRYIETIWNLRDELDGLAEPLFAIYDENQAADSRYLTYAEERLRALGLEVKTGGRGFAEEALVADLVVIDLYFGSGQEDADLSQSKKLLQKAMIPRVGNPPLVILMSRSENLELKRDEFRDDVGLIDSGFRIIRKVDLADGTRFELQLERLAQNAVDTRRLARFFVALEAGVRDAALRTLKLMRRLKLSDVAQIQQLLLDMEGEPTGSYLVDVFDRVLQHEIEAQEPIIDAAIELNDFAAAEHPPPYVAGSPELQELVERMFTQNAGRLVLPGAAEAVVSFGDLLQLERAKVENHEHGGSPTSVLQLPDDGIALVLTPACDLQRDGAPNILVVVGTVNELSPKDWRYGSDARTSAVRIDNTLRWIQWDLKHVDTVSSTTLNEARTSGAIKVVARLREAHALEIQQRVLSGLGRVGLVAPMPLTSAVEVEAYYPDPAGVPVRIDVPELNDGAVCFVGRDDAGKTVTRLVLTEGGCDGLQAAINEIAPELVADRARAALAHIQSSGDLGRVLAAGLDLRNVGPERWRLLDSLSGAPQQPQMGLVAWDYAPIDEPVSNKDLAKAGVILLIKTISSTAAGGIAAASHLAGVVLDAPGEDAMPDEHATPDENARQSDAQRPDVERS